VGHWGTAIRYRPAYYFLHSLETLVFQDRPFLWYAVRLLILQQFAGIFLYLAVVYLDGLLGLSLWIWFFSQGFWADIFSRLGPGEIYCVLGLVFGAYAIMILKSRRRLGWGLCFAAALLLAGSKEVFAPVMIVASGLLLWKGERNWWSILLNILSLLYSGLISTGVWIGVRSNAVDVLGQSASLFDRAAILKNLFRTGHFPLLFFCFGFFTWRFRKELRLRHFDSKWLVLLGSLAFFVLNFIFYAGRWPTGMRYDFPALALPPIGLLMVLKELEIGRFFSSRAVRMFSGVLLILISAGAIPGWMRLSQKARENVERTQITSEFVRRIFAAAQERPGSVFVVDIGDVLRDYEYYFSLKTYLEFNGFKNPVAVRIRYDDQNLKPDSLEGQLTANLQKEPQWNKERRPCVAISLNPLSSEGCEDAGLVFFHVR
jgi:hypothetical protein